MLRLKLDLDGAILPSNIAQAIWKNLPVGINIARLSIYTYCTILLIFIRTLELELELDIQSHFTSTAEIAILLQKQKQKFLLLQVQAILLPKCCPGNTVY